MLLFFHKISSYSMALFERFGMRRTRESKDLIEPLMEISVPGCEMFNVSDLLTDASMRQLKIAPISQEGLRPFFSKVERGVKPAVIKVQELKTPVSRKELLTVLGGRHEMTFAQICELLKLQSGGDGPKAEKGALSRNGGIANLFFVNDGDGQLRDLLIRYGDPKEVDDMRMGWSLREEENITRSQYPQYTRVFSL